MTMLASLTATETRVQELMQLVTTLSRPAAAAASAAGSAVSATGFADVLRATSASAAGDGSGGRGAQAVELARQFLGVPYVYGASDPSVGFDCSGLVQYVYHQLGVELPRGSRDQATVGQPVASIVDARPGDLVFTVDNLNVANGHVGIYAGEGKWIVAPHTGEVVKIENVPDQITAIRRVLPESSLTTIGGGA